MQIRKKLESGEPFYDEEERDRAMEVPPSFAGDVRDAIFDMYAAKQHVTLDTLLKTLQDKRVTRTSGWKWSRSTLYRFLTDTMHYTYGKRRTYYQNLKENVSIAAQRVAYIKKVQEYRAEGRPIFYQDETWVNKNMTPANMWLDDEGQGGRAVPQGKGERSIVCHIGGRDGFVDGAKLIFRGSKALKDSDYHTEMNSSVFLDWMRRKVLPAVPSRSVIVIDRATYHTTLTEQTKPAKSTFRKAQLAEWLVAHGVVHNGMRTVDEYMTMTKPELGQLCKENKPKPEYEVAVTAREFDCDVLFLPVGHPELNPIEMVWSYVKSYVAKHNTDFSLSEVERLSHAALDSFDSEAWQRYVDHCVKVERRYLELADDVPLDMDD
ncbi:hypothetical protein Poli38472_010607 [Pythium oligandrum]|uniref:Tc1-like transposase DDE domain-containing protein n=1 Tax=Pythium oligandrum TaxID=41045 RepID=A0A8K1F9Z1_PYTOL|nr:hypothetical protein Poli38472_010607 [Pythium oligandrum]|eukprot:TMW55725.1 hypothetical protein Poli38472_010607 [Pythium oligandrum]